MVVVKVCKGLGFGKVKVLVFLFVRILIVGEDLDGIEGRWERMGFE